jgi:uncharacterized protein (TIGR02453 family)
MTTFVTPTLFRFLGELRRHNEREWFNANKARYLAEVREPLLAFIEAVGPKLAAISPSIVADARASGGSLLRIYRDTRFSQDKTPYKTNAALSFWVHGPKDAETPGYYLHLEPRLVFLGAGLWRPGPDALRAIRQAIVRDPACWKRARRLPLSDHEPPLTRAPRGFPADHPLIDDLKRTSFTVHVDFTERQACSPGFPDRFVAACRRATSLVRFLAGALGLAF